MVLMLCLTLLPTAAFAEGEDVSISGGVIGGGETGGEGGGIYVAPGSPTEGGGGTYIPGEATRTEIWFVRKPDSIGRSYDGTTDGSMVPFGTPQFTDGTNTFELTEGTDFTAKKTFDSADAGDHTVTVEITLIGNAATEYKLKSGEEKFKIRGTINKAYPELTVSLSETTCTVGEKLLPLLSISGRQENAAVTYYYTQYQTLAGASEYEGSDVIPAIDENTAINSLDEEGNNTYYLYAKTAATKNYNEGLSNVVELTVNEAVVEAASVTRADGTDGGTYESLPAALNAAQDGDTVKLLANHTTNWSDVEAGEYSTLAVVKKTLTLELNVWTVDYLVVGEVVSDEAGGILESTDGNLTVADNVQGGSYGKIKNLEFVKGSLAIKGGWIGDYDGSKLTCNGNSGSVIISGGTVYNATVGDGATVTVTGGTGHAGNWCNDGTLNITDGTFGVVKFYNNSGTIAISGGTFSTLQNFDNTSSLIAPISLLAPGHAFYKDNTVQDGSRGDFLQDVTVKEHTHTMVNNKCACGLSCTHTNAEGASTIGKDGKCMVCGTQFAAGIGETYYTDVKSALDVASDGQTVKLLANEMLPDGIYVSKTLTLDLNGHSLDGYSLNVGGLTAMSQVRTGNLTVIDSSGGNGAVGVTVREGGTLVFDPKNDHTTLLQLEVWGGTVELYGGKISRSGLRLNNSITLGNLLPQNAGLAYYCGDTQLTLEEAASKSCDLVVKSCAHGGKNGFDENATACPYCNAPAVAETALNNRPQRRFADLQTALDADRDGGAELTLLTDVTGDYTIDGTKNTKLDLNGHSIKGTVTVKAAVGSNTTTLSNTKNTTTARIDKVVAHSGAELARPDKPAVIGTLTLAEGATWKTILSGKTLGYKVLNADGTHKWYARDDVNGSQLNNVIINILPITFEELNLKVDGKNLTGNQLKVERGKTVQLCASCNKDAEVTFSIKQDGATTPITLSGNDVKYTTVGTSTTLVYVAEYIFNDVGSYTISFTATKDGYSVTSTQKKLTVTKPNLSNAEITFPDGNKAAFNYRTATDVPMFVVTYKGQTLEKDKDFTITGGGSTYDVGPCTLTIKATDNGDYTGSKSAQWTVRPLKAAVSVGDIIKTYDGTTNLPENTKITFTSADSYYTGVPLPLAKGTDYEVLNAHYNSPDASETEKTVSFTIELKNAGYVFDDGTTQKDFTLNGAELGDKIKINKATVPMNNPTGTLNIINGTCQTYTYDFSKLLPEAPNGDYGTVRYDLGNRQTAINFTAHGYYLDPEIAEFEGSKLTLVGLYAKDGTATGQIGTVKVNVTTTNYENFQLTLVLNAVNQIKPTPDGTITASEITYGQTLSESRISGTMKDPDTGKSVNGTFAWTDGTINPNAGGYEAEWTFTPAAGYEKYATATGTVTVKVNKADPTFNAPTAQENLTYTGQEQALITAGSVTDYGPTMQYSLTENGTYSQNIPTGTDAGTYNVWYRVFGDANHNDTKPASVAVRIGQKPLTITGVTAASKHYDGTKNADITRVTFDNVTLKRDTDYTVTASFDDASVGSGKNVTATVTLMGQAANNYALEQSSFPTTGSIIKAAAPDFTKETALTIVNGHEKTYTVTLPALPTLETPKAYGALTYEIGEIKLNDGYYTSGAKVENGELTLPIQKNDVETTGSVGTVTVVIKSANYEDITLTVNVSAKNKLSPVLAGTLTLTPIKITYGEPLSKIKITGTMKAGDTVVEGTFSWQLPSDTILEASTSGHDVGWTFTPKDGNTYTEVTGIVKVPVAPKSIEGAAITLEKYEFQYNAAEQSPKITGVTLENWDETGITYDIKSGDKATDANDSISLTIEGTGNYTGTAMVEWKITPKTVTPAIEVASCTYTGDALEPTVTLKDGNEVIPTDEYTVEYSNNTNAGTGRVTIKDVAGGNYVIKEKTQDFTITKAAAPAAEAGSLTITNGLHETYSLDLSMLLPKLTAPCDYGTIIYDKKIDTHLGVGTFITLVNGKTGELTLEANRSGTDEGQFGTITVTISTSNYQDITLTINVSAKNRITPTGTPTLSKNAITYGDALNTIALSGKLHDNVNNVDVDGTFEWVDGTHIPVVGNGTYAAEWIFEPTDTEKYLTVSGRSNITVEKTQQYGKLSMAGYTYGKTPSTPTLTDRTGDLNAQVTYSYAAADSGSVQTWDISNPPALNAGTYRMYASIGDTDNYYGFEAVYCEFVVAKATPTYTVPTGLTAKYGQTLADVTLPDGWSWMDSSESVGGASTAAKTFQAKFTPKDTENYNTVENIELEVTVNKADGGNLKTVELEQKYTDASDHTYTPDWAGLPAGQDWTFSSEASIVLSKQDFAADGSLLTYAISGGKAGDKITITLKASCDNYEDFTITLNVTLTEKDDQKPLTITGAGSVVYGQTLTLTTTGSSGTGTVTYRIDTDASTGEATIDPETGVLTPVKVGSVSVIATKAGDNDYNDVTSAPFVLMIKPATPTGEPNYTKITTSGKTLKDAALTTKGSTLNPSDGKLEWVDDKGEPLPDDTTVKANTTYKWRFTPDDDNYTTLTGEVELYHKSSSSGGWYDSYYTIKATAGTGGSISPSGNVSVREGRDQTFTITPDKSYAVSNVKIDGKSIGAVKSYTFENVRRTHTIEVIFMKANGTPQTGVFVDVATGGYYEDAVDWAVENGITKGTDDTHFSPDGICTRAQAVTFLWRAAGSPKPETRTMPFADIPAGSYYYDAVLWAVENDITKGTSDTTFSPNMTCSRAQIVTFLWRSEKSPAAGTVNPFADVKSAAYYADAVLWAAKEDITKGTTNTTFSPDADCTRAQIVTFLWRCKK